MGCGSWVGLGGYGPPVPVSINNKNTNSKDVAESGDSCPGDDGRPVTWRPILTVQRDCCPHSHPPPPTMTIKMDRPFGITPS